VDAVFVDADPGAGVFAAPVLYIYIGKWEVLPSEEVGVGRKVEKGRLTFVHMNGMSERVL
jgi:hypothetical protein